MEELQESKGEREQCRKGGPPFAQMLEGSKILGLGEVGVKSFLNRDQSPGSFLGG